MDESYPDARPEPIGHSGTNESVLSASVIPEITYIKARFRTCSLIDSSGLHIKAPGGGTRLDSVNPKSLRQPRFF